MPEISLNDLEYSPSGCLKVALTSDTFEKELLFNLPVGTALHPDAVLATLGMILARSHDQIHLNFDVSTEMRAAVSRHCNARILGGKAVPPEPPLNSGAVGLAFSGGFDSITARDLLPGSPHLVSMDFGGNFARERPMFEAFNSSIVETNLVSIGLNRYSWAFMGVGNRLLRGSLKLGTLSFGTILEARDKYILRFKSQNQPGSSSLSDIALTPVINPILGLTEVATARYVVSRYPELVDAVLSSVANPGEAKSYRKALLVQAASLRLGGTPVDKPLPPNNCLTWGSNTAADFLAPYLVKVLGIEAVQAAYLDVLPSKLSVIADQLDLTFYERFNSNFYNGSWSGILSATVSRMVSNDIMPYTSTDFREFSIVAAFLHRTRCLAP